jgi:hypothetical protein
MIYSLPFLVAGFFAADFLAEDFTALGAASFACSGAGAMDST